MAAQDLLHTGVIRGSCSYCASPVVLVRKKDGDLRVCVDFRRLNAKTINAYPIPRIAETLEALHGAKWFCSQDRQSGYLQIGVREADKAKTAVTTSFGLFEFNRMPPATSQRLLERCLGGLNLKICLVYLDDVIVFGSTFKETLEDLWPIGHRFCWPGMAKNVEAHITNCERCVKRKSPDPPKASIVPILVGVGTVAYWFLIARKRERGHEHVLVVADSFTKYSWAFRTRNQQASSVTKLLWEKILVHFGFPQRLHSDRCRDIESRIIKDFCKVAGIDKARITPYHPLGNGQT